MNAQAYAIFDAAGVPRQAAIATAFPYRPDLVTVKDFPCLACYQTGTPNNNERTHSGQIDWWTPLSTKHLDDQHIYMAWISRTLMDLLEDYENASDGCIQVFPSSISSRMSPVRIVTGNDKMGLSLLAIAIDFQYRN